MTVEPVTSDSDDLQAVLAEAIDRSLFSSDPLASAKAVIEALREHRDLVPAAIGMDNRASLRNDLFLLVDEVIEQCDRGMAVDVDNRYEELVNRYGFTALPATEGGE